MKTAVADVHGEAAEGFGRLADAFRQNFADGLEIGAAFALYRDGEPVVDLWGGRRDLDAGLPWDRDTLVTVFSTTKGMASVAMAVAHARGLFALDERVAAYWPEFAQRGKEAITVRQLLTHQAGLAVIDTPIDLGMLADPDALGAVLAAQAPKWPPGTAHGYHGQSLGWYESQLLRRVDPQHRTIGHYFADEVARPLDLAFHIGLPDDVRSHRLATIVGGRPAAAVLHLREMPGRLAFALANPFGQTARVFMNPKALRSAKDINRRELLRIELPSVNGTGDARSIAKAYSVLASGGGALGVGRETLAELERATAGRRDRILKVDTAFSFGFMKPCSILPFGSSPRAYGHTGAGGSFAYADPDHGIGYAYVMNRMGFGVPTDARDLRLRDALQQVLS